MTGYDHDLHIDLGLVRVRVTDSSRPPRTRVFDLPRRAPLGWLRRAFLLATGRSDDSDDEGWCYEVRDVTGSGGTHGLLGETPIGTSPESGGREWEVEVLGYPRTRSGQPLVSVVVDESTAAESAPADWIAAAPPFRAEHVQHELTLAFGHAHATVERSGILTGRNGVGSTSPLVALLSEMTPIARLALRAHLDDAGLLHGPVIDDEQALSLTAGIRWLVGRLAQEGAQGEGVAQGADGWLPLDIAREAEDALDWHGPGRDGEMPGERLVAFARSSHIARRWKGRVLATVKGHRIASSPRTHVAHLADTLWGDPRRYSFSRDHAMPLALLAIADGSAADADGAVELTTRGLAAMEHLADDAGERARIAGRRVATIMSAVAPFGGRGGYGTLTPAVRSLAHVALLGSPRNSSAAF